MDAKLFTCLREICRQCYEFNNLCHMCAYSAILRLKIINNKSIEAIELSKIPRDIRGRVALSEIPPRTYLGRGDVVQQPHIIRSYLGCWAYQIYINERSDRYDFIYIYIYFLGRGQEITSETLFFFIFYFPQSTFLKDMCIGLFMKPAFYFWTYFFIQTPLWLSLNSLDNNIFSWYFPFEIMNIWHFVNHHSKFKSRLIKCTHTAKRRLEYDLQVTKCNSNIKKLVCCKMLHFWLNHTYYQIDLSQTFFVS